MKITLDILKEDILEDNYLDSERCPITKALHRAGFNNLYDNGTITGYIDDKSITIDNHNKFYLDLVLKLFGMYNSFSHKYPDSYYHTDGIKPKPIPVESFTHVIEWE